MLLDLMVKFNLQPREINNRILKYISSYNVGQFGSYIDFYELLLECKFHLQIFFVTLSKITE